MSPRRTTARCHGGFTIIETALATVVVGIGIVAMVHAMAAGTRVNSQGRDITHAVFLAQEVREWTLQLPFSDPDDADAGNPPGPDGADPQSFVDDLDDLMDVTFTPPRDGQGQVIEGMADWSQTIEMEWRDPNSLTTAVPVGSTEVISVNVTIRHNGQKVTSSSWLVARRNP